MKSNGIRLAYIFAIVYAFFSSFLVLREIDNMGPLVGDSIIVISGTQTTSSQEVVQAVQQVADKHGVAVMRLVNDLRDPGSVRHLYLAVGDQESSIKKWLSDGYPSFTNDIKTEIHPFQELSTVDPRDHYFLAGNGDAAKDATTELIKKFNTFGFEVKSKPYYELSSMAFWLLNKPFGSSAIVAILFVAMLVATSVISGVKNYAVQRLHGANYWHLISRDFRRIIRFVIPAIVGAALVSAIALWFYDGCNQWQIFAKVTGFVLLGLVLVAGLAHTVALAITRGLPILQSLKGHIPDRWAIGGVYLVRFPATIITIFAVISASLAFTRLVAYQSSKEAWRTAGESVQINFSSNFSESETDKLAIRTGKWLIDEEASGQMILVGKRTFNNLADGLTVDVLVVNDNYLRAQDIRDDSNNRVQEIGGSKILAIVPPSLAKYEDRIVGSTKKFSRTTAKESSEVPIEVIRGLPGQKVFNYGSSDSYDRDAILEEPIVLVVNAGTKKIDADGYMSYASQGGVLLQDGGQAAASAEKAGVGDFILSFRLAAQDAAKKYSELIADLRVHVFNVVAALLVLLATAIGLADVYLRKNAQRTFVRFICGWRFTRAHLIILSGELLVGLAIVGWSLWQTLPSMLSGYTGGSKSMSVYSKPSDVILFGGWLPILMLALGIANFAFFLAATYFKSSQLIRTHSPEAQL